MQVRAATARLLAAIAGVRTLSPLLFETMVPVDTVLARLVLDLTTPSVAEPLVAALVPSFFPPGAKNSEVRQAAWPCRL